MRQQYQLQNIAYYGGGGSPKGKHRQRPRTREELTDSFQEFLNRQTTQSYERAKKETLDSLRKSEAVRKRMAEKGMGANTLDGFRHLLKVRFGTVVRGWNQGLDTDHNGRLSFHEFVTACRSLGYA